MRKKILITIGVCLVIILGFVLISFILNHKGLFNNKMDNSLLVDDINVEIDIYDKDQKINWSDYSENVINLTESIKITDGGVYDLFGNIDNGCITIDTSENVKLVLNGVTITSNNGPAINVLSAENVVIVLNDGTNNILVDGDVYAGFDEDVGGVIYSKADVTFEGTGTLTIDGNYADGIVSKDNLKIIDGTYIINTVDDAIRGKDSVYIVNGDFKIKAGGDGIKSTNNSTDGKGFVIIDNGKYIIDADLDAICAETKLLIVNGIFDITTGGGTVTSSDSNIIKTWGRPTMSNNIKVNTDSAKGIKANDNLVIENGTFNFDTSDDAIHGNNYIGIKDGKITISSSDDGIHADKELIIDGGEVTITKSYEGFEAAKITINNGLISVVSSDDGINAAFRNDNSGINGRFGQNNFSEETANILTINGGNITVDASGDGLDANGSIYINGGTIIVHGPTKSDNGALDYDSDCVVNGGTLVASGASGMAQGIGTNSKQYGVLIGFSRVISAGENVSIKDSKGNEIISHVSSKDYSSLVVSTKDLTKNSTYTISIDDETYSTFTVSSISNVVGNTTNNGGMGGMHSRR